jgi:LPXTG-motif cell wall-anchored protein
MAAMGWCAMMLRWSLWCGHLLVRNLRDSLSNARHFRVPACLVAPSPLAVPELPFASDVVIVGVYSKPALTKHAPVRLPPRAFRNDFACRRTIGRLWRCGAAIRSVRVSCRSTESTIDYHIRDTTMGTTTLVIIVLVLLLLGGGGFYGGRRRRRRII